MSRSPAEELAGLERQQDRVVRQLTNVAALIDTSERERDRLVGEARRLAVPWERIGDAVGMARQNAWRKWRATS